MKIPKVSYRDVTHEPEAAARAARGPELREGLLANGFTPVGLAEFRLAALGPRPMPLPTHPDLARLDEVAENGEVDEVLVSPDELAFAAVENAFDGPVVSIRTLMDSGRVVETTMKPTRPPHTFSPTGKAPDGQDALANLPMTATLKLMEFGMGKLPLWPRGDTPQAGYHVELVDTRDVKALWLRHRQRLQAVRQSDPSAIRPHTLLPLYMSFNCRTTEIIGYQAKWGNRISSLLLVPFLLAIPLSLLLTRQFPDNIGTSPFGEWFFLAPLLLMLVVAISTMLLMGIARTHIVPRLPGPGLRPASELLAEAHSRLTTAPPEPSPTPTYAAARLPRPPGWLFQNKTLIDRIITGLFMGVILGNKHAWVTDGLSLQDILLLAGWGAFLGAITSAWMISGTSLKNKAVCGALGGLCINLILVFLPLEGAARYFVSGVIGALTWAGIGWIFRWLK
jgi:hypothetical protein